MKKKCFLIIIFLILFVSCKSSENKNVSNTLMITTEPAVKPAPLHEPMIERVPPSEDSAWAEAYADLFMQNIYPPYFILFDVDFDGIPELFFYASGYGANMWVTAILSFSEQGIKEIIAEEQIPAQFELYKNKQTGETRWMTVMDSFRSSFAHYNYEYKWIDFNDFLDIRTEFFFKWDFEAVTTDFETNEYEEVYYLFENENEMVEVEYEVIERRRQELFSRYELIETHLLYASTDDFTINKGANLNAENLDRKSIIEFLLQWEYSK